MIHESAGVDWSQLQPGSILLGVDAHAPVEVIASSPVPGTNSYNVVYRRSDGSTAVFVADGSAQIALRHAIGMYNTGRLDGGARYVKEVLAAADIHEQYGTVPSVPENEAMRSSLLVRVPVARHGSSRPANKVIAPSRAPILVTIARTAQLTIF